MNMCKCECEHASHFDHSKFSPNGNPNHKYGIKYNDKFIQSIKTPFGTFNVCRDCAKDCYAEFVKD